MVQEVVTNEQSADQQSRCEIDWIRIAEGEYLRLDEVQLGGSVLCVSHAELLRLEDHPRRCSAKCSRWISGWKASTGRPKRWALGVQSAIETHRDDLVEQIRFNRAQIELIHDELRKDHDGTT